MQPLSRPKIGAAPAQCRHGNHRVKLKSPARSLFAQVTVACHGTRGNWLTRGREGMDRGGGKKEWARGMHGGTCGLYLYCTMIACSRPRRLHHDDPVLAAVPRARPNGATVASATSLVASATVAATLASSGALGCVAAGLGTAPPGCTFLVP